MFKFAILFGFILSCAISYEVKPLSSDIWFLPYAPYWDPFLKRLIITDFLNGTIINYNSDGRVYVATVPGIPKPSFLIPLEKCPNQYLTSNHLSATVIEWNGFDAEAKIIRETFTVETAPDYVENNWNVAIASPEGTFFGGTFRGEICGNTSAPPGGIYSYDEKCGVQDLTLPNYRSSSGFAFNIQGNKLYNIDSCNYVIQEFDYDKKTGKTSNARIVFDSRKNNVGVYNFMLGLTIDTEGYLYTTMYYGGEVLKINPRTNEIVESIKVPAEVVSAATWGGDNFESLFLTTVSKPLEINTGAISCRPLSPDSGKVFVVSGLNARGFPANKICI